MKTITLSLPRKPLNRELPTRGSVQLHTFTDASLIGMSTLVYIRVVSNLELNEKLLDFE